jgi:hypothetical protein
MADFLASVFRRQNHQTVTLLRKGYGVIILHIKRYYGASAHSGHTVYAPEPLHNILGKYRLRANDARPHIRGITTIGYRPYAACKIFEN